jgi:hypothetical protein
MLSLWPGRDLKRDDPGGEARGDHDPDEAATAPPVAAGVVDYSGTDSWQRASSRQT